MGASGMGRDWQPMSAIGRDGPTSSPRHGFEPREQLPDYIVRARVVNTGRLPACSSGQWQWLAADTCVVHSWGWLRIG